MSELKLPLTLFGIAVVIYVVSGFVMAGPADVSIRLGWPFFSNAPFRWVKRFWFHPWVLWSAGVPLLTGLLLALAGGTADRMGLFLPFYLLTLPFQLWVASLALIGSLLGAPRFLGSIASILVLALLLLFVSPSLGKRFYDYLLEFEEGVTKPDEPTGGA